VAALIELARLLKDTTPERTLRLVAFANEEPPFFTSGEMGSQVHARRARDRGERVSAMLSLETLGYYSEQPGSQQYPFPLGLVYPATGNFVGFVGNLGSARLVRRCVELFRAAAAFPSQGGALPGAIPGVGWSDHWSFWQEGYEAVMVTDTALYRYPWYHSPGDTPGRLDYGRLARVTHGLAAVAIGLAEVRKSLMAQVVTSSARNFVGGLPGDLQGGLPPCSDRGINKWPFPLFVSLRVFRPPRYGLTRLAPARPD
jgi:Zn-dependent M28 family amino/carboxypeptidase